MAEKNQYLYDNFELFRESEMFLGSDAYGHGKIHPWYRYLYICRLPYSLEKIEHKIGITNNLKRRRDEIQRAFELARQLGSRAQVEMVWCWSMPYPEVVELAVKRFLKEFIKQLKDKSYKEESILFWPKKREKNDNDDENSSSSEEEGAESTEEEVSDSEEQVSVSEKGYTEIINGVAVIPLILYVRLIILYVYLHEKYVPTVPNLPRLLEGVLGGTTNLIVNALKYDGVMYRGLWSGLRGIEMQAINMTNAQTRRKISKKHIQESKEDILHQIGQKITQLIGQRNETERLCDIAAVYNLLSIDINLNGIAFERYKSPFKFQEHVFQSEYGQIPAKKKKKGRRKPDKYNNSVPNPSRNKDVHDPAIIYVAFKLDFDGTPSIYRFFPAKILKMNRRVSQGFQVQLLFLYPDLEKAYSKEVWPKNGSEWWEYHWENEREDFRDRPNRREYSEKLWGLWTGVEPTTSQNNLADLNILYSPPIQTDDEHRKKKKKKKKKKKQKKAIDYTKLDRATLRKMARSADVLTVNGNSKTVDINRALQERDRRLQKSEGQYPGQFLQYMVKEKETEK